MAELVDQCDVVFHLAAAVGVQADRREPRADDRDQRPRHRGRPGPGQQEEEEGADRLDLRGLRAEHRRAVSRGWRPGAGRDHQGALELRLLEGDRRVPGAGVLARTKLPTVIVRLFNTVGPRQTGQYGMVVPTFVKQALAGRPITVYGDGTQSRCFTDVGDVVGALVGLMDHPGAVGEVFNVGSSEEVTIEALAERVKELTGSASEIVLIPYEQAYGEGFEDMPRRVPDIRKIEALIGYRAKKSLDEILSGVIDYFRDAPSATSRPESLPV